MTKTCKQCGRPFEARSENHTFCERQCQLDHRNGRPEAESARRRETGFAWEPVREARPITINMQVNARPLPRKKNLGKTWKTAVIAPDPQFGFHWTEDGLDPYHDDRCLKILRTIVEAERPDLTIWLGDVLDLPMFGRYRQFPAFARTFQPALDRAHEELAVTAEFSEETRYISGNHDERLHLAIVDNLVASAGIRPARRRGDPGNDWPALSVPSLLRLPEIGVDYIGAYPAGISYINENIAAVHGRYIGNRRQSAAQIVVEHERISVIYGHTHHRAMAAKTREANDGQKDTVAYSPGCLCRTDGTVPSTKSGMDAFGRPVKVQEDWQNGIGIVRYEEGDGRFSLEDIPIYSLGGDKGVWAMWQGQVLTA